MMARLIQRFSRLLAAPPTFSASSCSVPPVCIRACHPMQPSLPPALPLHTSALCRYTDSLPALEQKVNTLSEESFIALIVSMTQPEELLRISYMYSSNVNRVSTIIGQLAKVTNSNKADVVNDRRFIKLLSTVDKQIQAIWDQRLVGLLVALYTLRVDEKNHGLRSVETEVRWRLRRLNIKLLVQLAQLIVPHVETEAQKALFASAVKYVELRWTEVNDTKTLMHVICTLSQPSNTLLQRMEDKVLEFAEFLTVKESRNIAMTLAAQNYRSLPILRALSFYLAQPKKELPPSLIVDLAYAYAKLNFFQHPVLQIMASSLQPKLPQLSSKEMTAVMRSFATLGFLHPPLCEAIAQVCLERSNILTPAQLSSVIISFAHLNFLPSQQEEFFSMVVQRLSTELDSLIPTMLVDLVWSLCVLQLVTPAFLQKALEPKICNLFMGESFSYRRKLTQINATAQLECPEYQGPLLPLHLLHTIASQTGEGKLSPLQENLRNALCHVFPNEDACCFNVRTIYGHQIDAEFVLDSENNSLALRNFVDPHVLDSTGKNALPQGARRFAVKTWEFSNFCLCTKDLMGAYALCRRHLRAAGFLLVEVPFHEWMELRSEWQKSAFLQDQIQKAVAEEMSV